MQNAIDLTHDVDVDIDIEVEEKENDRNSAEEVFVPWSDDEIPHKFKCPISLEIMTDPVLCSDGFYYDRECIVNWLSQHHRSPMTNLELHNPSIRRDQGLAQCIERWIAEKWQIFRENEANRTLESLKEADCNEVASGMEEEYWNEDPPVPDDDEMFYSSIMEGQHS